MSRLCAAYLRLVYPCSIEFSLPFSLPWRHSHDTGLPHFFQVGVTPIDWIVTAATTPVNPYTKEGVESLRILPYTSVKVRVVNSLWLKFNAVNGQSPKISVVNGQNAKKSWSKFWPCGHSCDYRVYGSDTPLFFHTASNKKLGGDTFRQSQTRIHPLFQKCIQCSWQWHQLNKVYRNWRAKGSCDVDCDQSAGSMVM